MIGALIGLILVVIVLGALWWAAQQLLALVTLAEPFATILRVLVVLVGVVIVVWFILVILGMFGVEIPMALRGPFLMGPK